MLSLFNMFKQLIYKYNQYIFIYLSLICSNQALAENCDTLLYSSGGKSNAERVEMELLRDSYQSCPENIHYGNDGLGHQTNTSNAETFYDNFEEFSNTDSPKNLTVHIAGHGTYKPILERDSEEIRGTIPQPSDIPKKLPVNLKSDNFLQINIETCLSGNALSQMLGIPPTQPFDQNDYQMYSKDGDEFPSALKLRQSVLESSEGENGRTACGLASATGHTSVFFPLQGRTSARRRTHTLADTIGLFTAKNGRKPTVVETEHCALRNERHPSAPISSSNILLEHLSHQIEEEHGPLFSGNSNLLEVTNSEQCLATDLLSELNPIARDMKSIELYNGINAKKEELQSNIQYILGKNFRGYNRSENRLRRKMRDINAKLTRLMKFLENKVAEVDKAIEKEREKKVQDIKRKYERKRNYYRRRSKAKQERLHKKVFKDTVAMQVALNDYVNNINTVLKDSEECKNNHESLYEFLNSQGSCETQLYSSSSSNGNQGVLDCNARSSCKAALNSEIEEYNSQRPLTSEADGSAQLLKENHDESINDIFNQDMCNPQLDIKIGDSISRHHSWKYSSRTLSETCKQKLKEHEDSFTTETRGKTYNAYLLNSPMTKEGRTMTSAEVEAEVKRIDDQYQGRSNNNYTVLSVNRFRDDMEVVRPTNYPIGGSTGILDNDYYTKLMVGIVPIDKNIDLDYREEEELEKAQELLDQKQIRLRSRVSRNYRTKLQNLRKYQLLNTQLRSLLALDHLQKNLNNPNSRELAEKMIKMNQCERNGRSDINPSEIVCR